MSWRLLTQAWLPLEPGDAAVGSAALGWVEGELRLSGRELLWGPATRRGFPGQKPGPDTPALSKVGKADSR